MIFFLTAPKFGVCSYSGRTREGKGSSEYSRSVRLSSGLLAPSVNVEPGGRDSS